MERNKRVSRLQQEQQEKEFCDVAEEYCNAGKDPTFLQLVYVDSTIRKNFCIAYYGFGSGWVVVGMVLNEGF